MGALTKKHDQNVQNDHTYRIDFGHEDHVGNGIYGVGGNCGGGPEMFEMFEIFKIFAPSATNSLCAKYPQCP